MSKRNFILLIIGLIIITVVIFSVIYSSKQKTPETTGEKTNFLANFNPFKRGVRVDDGASDNSINLSGEVPSGEDQISTERLQKISDKPVAGYGVFMKERFKEMPTVIPTITQDTADSETENTDPETEKKSPTVKKETAKPTPPPTEFIPSLRYVDRITGNIYQTFADKIDERQFTQTIIPRVHDAYFGNKGESVVMRYLKDDDRTIETFVGALPKEVLGGDILGDVEVAGTFLPENISDISISKDNLRLFYMFKSEDRAIGITSMALGEKKVQVFSSPFTEWLSWWPNNEMITLTTKPSYNVPGYMYAVNPSKKDFNKILGDINGLTTLASPDGKLVLYADNTMSLFIYNRYTGATISTGAKTLPEKCTWNGSSTHIYCSVPKEISRGQYPDSWYQGAVSFSDSIWKIDPVDGSGSIISDLASKGEQQNIDGIKLALDENESYLFLINKTDSMLWELRLN